MRPMNLAEASIRTWDGLRTNWSKGMVWYMTHHEWEETKFVRVLLSMGTSICSTFQRQCPGNKIHPRVPSSPLGLTIKFLEPGGSCTEADLIALVKQQAQQ